MKSLFVLSALMLAACDTDKKETPEHPDRMHPPDRPGAPPPGAEGREMGRPDMNGTADGRPGMGRDGHDGREGGRDGMSNFRVDPSDPNSATIEELVAVVAGDPKHKDLKGTVTFRSQGGNVAVDAAVDGLPKGTHGYHVHVYGDCSALDAKSPGEHLEFHERGGGNTPPSGPGGPMAGSGSGSGVSIAPAETASTHVVGNLGELEADAKGHATASRPIEAHLRQLLGRAVVIHEKGNDETQPDGAAGGGIACGVIGIANPGDKASAAKEPEQK